MGRHVNFASPDIAYLFPFVITAIHAYRYTTVVMLALSVMVGR